MLSANQHVDLENLCDFPKSRASSQKPKPATRYEHRVLNTNITSSLAPRWCPLKPAPGEGNLDPGRLLRVISWNIYFEGSDLQNHASSAMDKLREDLGDRPTPVVIMLQGVHHLSLKAICEHWWIRKNFKLSSVQAPRPCFTIIMVSQHIQAETWFRVPFPSERDAIGVEIPISILEENPNTSEKVQGG
jgi:hypothetical protein